MEAIRDFRSSTANSSRCSRRRTSWSSTQPGSAARKACCCWTTKQLELHIAERVAQIPNLAERQAEAAEEALANAPEFELIIRELCDVAGHALQKITMGDPNYEHDGETVLAWHFTTDHGDFIMVEEDEEAFMITPQPRKLSRP